MAHTSLDDAMVIGVLHLDRLWARSAQARRGQSTPLSSAEWRLDQIVLAGLGLAVEETTEYLLRNDPTFSQFEQWILEINGGAIEPHRIERIDAAIRGEPPPPAQKEIIAAIDTPRPS